MLWGFLSAAGIGGQVRNKGKMKGAKYIEILDENLLQSAQDLRLGKGSPFNRTKTLKHTAKTMQEWLRETSLKSSQSPDLNPIEHLWRDLRA
jgi:transposase